MNQPRQVIIYLAEKGIDVPRYEFDYANGEHRSPDYRKINHAGPAPTLVLQSGLAITDSASIVEYLEERHPERPMIGSDPAERARMRAVERLPGQGTQPFRRGRRAGLSLRFRDPRRPRSDGRRRGVPRRRRSDDCGLHELRHLPDGSRAVRPPSRRRSPAA